MTDEAAPAPTFKKPRRPANIRKRGASEAEADDAALRHAACADLPASPEAGRQVSAQPAHAHCLSSAPANASIAITPGK